MKPIRQLHGFTNAAICEYTASVILEIENETKEHCLLLFYNFLSTTILTS